MTQAEARKAAIAAGASPAEVDAFIAKEGGARTSAQRITSAFGVAGSVGTDNLTAYHAQKATPGGADASAKGTYLSGAEPGSAAPAPGIGGGGAPGAGSGGPAGAPPVAGLTAAAPPQSLGSGGADVDMGMGIGGIKPTLGTRIPPQDSLVIAGLRRAY